MTRHRITADYPSKRVLTKAEALRVLESGPELAWLQPWAEHGVLMPAGSTGQPFRCGYVHLSVVGDEPPVYDVHLFHDRDGLAWALEHLYRLHPRHEGCQLWYFTPDEPIRLRLHIEPDDAEPEASE